MRLQDHFHPQNMPLGLCLDCCQEWIAGTLPAGHVPVSAIVTVPCLANFPQGQAPGTKNVCGRHLGDDGGGNGAQPQARRPFLLAQGGMPLPPPARPGG